jgi:hypothetical protein
MWELGKPKAHWPRYEEFVIVIESSKKEHLGCEKGLGGSHFLSHHRFEFEAEDGLTPMN